MDILLINFFLTIPIGFATLPREAIHVQSPPGGLNADSLWEADSGRK